MRAEVTADNTSIRVSWGWSCQGVLDFVRVHYRPEGGSLMNYTVNSVTATSATLPNLQCNTKYTVSVHARGGQINRTSASRMVSLSARGIYIYHTYITFHTSLVPRPRPAFHQLLPVLKCTGSVLEAYWKVGRDLGTRLLSYRLLVITLCHPSPSHSH